MYIWFGLFIMISSIIGLIRLDYHNRVFTIVLLKYTCVSLIMIFTFTLYYFNYTVGEISEFKAEKQIESIEMIDDSLHTELQNKMSMKNVTVINKKNVLDLFEECLHFSAMTYFTVGYGDIHVSGILRYISILEAWVGFSVLGLYVSVMLSKLTSTSSELDAIKIYLSRGYSILYLVKCKGGDYYIPMIDANFNSESIFAKLNKNEEEFLNYFVIEIYSFLEFEYNENLNDLLYLILKEIELNITSISKKDRIFNDRNKEIDFEDLVSGYESLLKSDNHNKIVKTNFELVMQIGEYIKRIVKKNTLNIS